MAIRVAVADSSPRASVVWEEVFRRSKRVEFLGLHVGARSIPPLRPDVVLISLRIPDQTLEVARFLHGVLHWCSLIVWGSAEHSTIVSAARAGVRGFIPWNYGIEAILNAVHRVGDGEFYWPHEVRAALMQFMLELPSHITRRELDVLRLHISVGWPQKKVAAMLSLSESTIEKHLAAARRKMDAPTNAMAWEKAKAQACL